MNDRFHKNGERVNANLVRFVQRFNSRASNSMNTDPE